MKTPNRHNDWPEVWQQSFEYDRLEVFGEIRHSLGYAYAYANRFERTIQLIKDVLPAGSHILDVAAAQGNFTLTLAELGYNVTWNDLRHGLIDYVKLKYEKGQVDFAPGNVFELEFDQLFDGILITEIIEHVAHPDEFLLKISKLLRPGGYVIMTTPNGAYFRNNLPRFSDHPDPSIFESEQFKPNSDGHIFLLYPDEVRKLAAQAALTTEKLVAFTPPFIAGHMKSRLLLPLLPQSMIQKMAGFVEALPPSISLPLLLQLGAILKKP